MPDLPIETSPESAASSPSSAATSLIISHNNSRAKPLVRSPGFNPYLELNTYGAGLYHETNTCARMVFGQFDTLNNQDVANNVAEQQGCMAHDPA